MIDDLGRRRIVAAIWLIQGLLLKLRLRARFRHGSSYGWLNATEYNTVVLLFNIVGFTRILIRPVLSGRRCRLPCILIVAVCVLHQVVELGHRDTSFTSHAAQSSLAHDAVIVAYIFVHDKGLLTR